MAAILGTLSIWKDAITGLMGGLYSAFSPLDYDLHWTFNKFASHKRLEVE